MNVGVRKISLMVGMGSNPHHSWLGLTEQQNLTLFRGEARTWCGARDYCSFAMVVGMAVLGATGGASKASDNCSFAKISGNNKGWCNGRSELYSVIT